MGEELIFLLIQLALCVLLILWGSIAISLIYRKRRSKVLRNIEVQFADVVSNFLYGNEDDQLSLIDIQRKFKALGISPNHPKSKNVQYLIKLMLRTQGSLLGRSNERLKVLYQQIPPYRASVIKLKGKDWYNKARGIREIYEMNQGQYLKEIIPLRNHKNIYVRREAQIALVVFLGWGSLRFLPYLRWNVTLWQQIKIVEKLHDLYEIPNIAFLRKAYRAESVYAKQLLIRIIRKYELIGEIDYVLDFIDDKNYELREAAIYCVCAFNLPEEKMDRLKSVFHNIPNNSHKRQLLGYISTHNTLDVAFYQNLLYTGNDYIKLNAAEVLWSRGYKELVQDFYYQQYTKNEEIYVD